MPKERPYQVSVLMTVFNGGSFLRSAVESILSQSYRDFQFVIINDGSTDGSRDYLDKVARTDERIRLFHQPNRGRVAALNKGLEEAATDFVALMDADDEAEPQRLEVQAAYLMDHRHIAAVGSAITLIDATGAALRVQQYPQTPRSIRALLKSDSAFANSTVMMRRALAIGVGGYRTMFPLAQDYDLWLRLSEKYELANLPQPLVKYRTHHNSVSVARAADQIVCRRMAQFSAAQRSAGKPDPLDDSQFSFTNALASGQARGAGTAASVDLTLRWIGSGDQHILNTLRDVLDALARGGLFRAALSKRVLLSLPNAPSPGRKSVAATAIALLLRPHDLRSIVRILRNGKRRSVR